MKRCASFLAALLLLSASLAPGEDFKTVDGREYKNATLTRVEGDGIVIRNKTRISKLYFLELPKDIQERFHYNQATPTPAAREPVKLEPQQDVPSQVDKGSRMIVVGQRSGYQPGNGAGRVVVVGQSAVSWKAIVAGIVLLIGVVLAVVRSRF